MSDTQQNLEAKHRGYVVANRTNAAFYVDGKDHRFKILTRLSSPEGDWKEHELDSDRPGRGFSSAAGGVFHHSLDRTFHRHEEIAKRFSHLVSKKIEYFQKEQGWDELVLVAEPHFLGLLKSALNPQVRKILRREVPREYVYKSQDELRNYIHEAMGEEKNPLNKILKIKKRTKGRLE